MATNLMPTVDRIVTQAWNSLQTEIQTMGGEARPKAAADVFKVRPSAAGIEVVVAPVTLRLKEKAAATECVLFVTIEGCLLFPIDGDRNNMRACKFQTRVGYFREIDGGKLKHVYGVHYDHDNELPAHPVYHSQMASMAGFVEHINSAFHSNFDGIEKGLDLVQGLLRNVRIPTAHMDPFSVFLQVAGDHLVSDASDQKVVDAFDRMRTAFSVFRSLPAAAGRLDAAMDQKCFRSNHWYL